MNPEIPIFPKGTELEQRIINFDIACQLIHQLHQLGKPTILAQGCFDILHPGHIEYLHQASQHGILFVGLENDQSIKLNKGPNRPIKLLNQRLLLIASLRSVAFAFAYSDSSQYDQDMDAFTHRLAQLAPDFLAISQDDPYLAQKIHQAKSTQITPLLLSATIHHSTTEIIQQILSSNQT